MYESEIEKLRKEIDDTKDDLTAIALRDLFALGCFLHVKGDKGAGMKACDAVLNAVGYKTKFPEESDAILSNLERNEKYFIKSIRAHMEITALIRSW